MLEPSRTDPPHGPPASHRHYESVHDNLTPEDPVQPDGQYCWNGNSWEGSAPTGPLGEKGSLIDLLEARFDYVNERLNSGWLMDGNFTVADCYLATMLLWANQVEIDPSESPLADYQDRIMSRSSLKETMEKEGLME